MTIPAADPQLETLTDKGLIELATRYPELEYLFRHWLVQDAAYGSLLKQERRELHGRVGEALEELYPDRRDELAPVLAMHFEQAGATEKAINYYADGAKSALGRYAIQEAFAAFDRAATLIDETSPVPGPGADQELPAELERRRRRRIEMEIGRAEAGYSFRTPEEAFEALDRVVPAAEELGDVDLIERVHMLIALGRLQNGEAPTSAPVRRSLDRIEEIGKAKSDPSTLAVPKALVGLSQVFSGPVRDGVAALEEALPLLEGRMDSIGAAFSRGALAIGYAHLGEFEKADASARQATEIAGRGDLIAQLDALIAEAYVRSVKGELEQAVPIAQQCVDQAETTGATACLVISTWILGDAFHRQGRFAEARDILQRGADISLVVERRVWRPTLQAWLSAAAIAMGDTEDQDWDDALATARSIGNQVGEAGVLWKRAESEAARGDLESAGRDFEASAELIEAQGMRPWLARVLRVWGDALRTAGRPAEAAPIYQRALALFEELGLDKEVAAVRATLAVGEATLTYD